MAKPCAFAYLKRDWFGLVCEFLAGARCSISTVNPPYFSKKCDGDVNLMDSFLKARFSKRWLKACNRCRIFLLAISLSDIVDAIGHKIPKENMECYDRLPSSLIWPLQVWPSRWDRIIWRKALIKLFVKGKKFLILQNPLGQWCPDTKAHHRDWKTVIYTDKKHVYQFSRHGWHHYRSVNNFPQYILQSQAHQCAIPLESEMPAEVLTVNEAVVVFQPDESKLLG